MSCDWLRVQVLKERFLLETRSREKFIDLKDVFSGVFRLLPHTPIKAMGLNMSCYCLTNDVNDWHAVGDHFSPKDDWQKILKGRAGLARMVVSSNSDGSSKGEPRTTITISSEKNEASSMPYIVSVQQNEHYLFEQSSGEERLKFLELTLEKRFLDFEIEFNSNTNMLINAAFEK